MLSRKHLERLDVHFAHPNVGLHLVEALLEPHHEGRVFAVVDVVLQLLTLTMKLRYLALKLLLKEH